MRLKQLATIKQDLRMQFHCKKCEKNDTETKFYSYMRSCCIECHKIRNKKYKNKKIGVVGNIAPTQVFCKVCGEEKQYPTDFYLTTNSKACRDCHKKDIAERAKKTRAEGRVNREAIKDFEQKHIKALEEQIRLLNLLVDKKDREPL